MFKENEDFVHKFKHCDVDSDVVVVDKCMDVYEGEILIEDNINTPQPTPPNEGYVSLPSKLSLNLFIGWMVHLLVLTSGGVSMYMSLKAEQSHLGEKVDRIEAAMYTAEEAKFRREMFEKDIATLKEDLKGEKK